MSCWSSNGVLLLPGEQLSARLWLCESGLSVRIRGYCGPGSRQDDPASFIGTPTIIITCVSFLANYIHSPWKSPLNTSVRVQPLHGA